MNWIYLIAGGVAGTVTRYLVVSTAYQKIGSIFPFGTLIVNLIGCFLIGVFDVIAAKKIAIENMNDIRATRAGSGSGD